MTSFDWTPILQALGAVLGTVITGLMTIYVPRAIAAYEKATGVPVSAQEKANIYASASTAAELLTTFVEHGLLTRQEATSPDHPAVATAACSALARVPDSAVAQGMTQRSMQAIVAARVASLTRPPTVTDNMISASTAPTPTQPTESPFGRGPALAASMSSTSPNPTMFPRKEPN